MQPGTAHRLRSLIALTAAAWLTACSTVGPPTTPPAPLRSDMPSRWQASADAAPVSPAQQDAELARWWRRLGDPQLDGLVDAALAGSGNLQLAQARLRQARASREQAAGARFPTVTASSAVSRSRAPTTGGGGHDLYDLGFDARWEADLFGGTQRAIEAAGADLAASAANVDNTRVSLVAEVAQNYVDLRAAQKRLAIARENLAAQSETLQITAWRNQAGLASASDVEQARTNREQTRATIPDFEVAVVAATNRLAVLTGRAPGALTEALAAPRPLPTLPASIATAIPAAVLRQRPDLIAAEHTLAAETARVGVAMAQRYPSLSLAGSFGWQAFNLSGIGTAAAIARSLSGTLAATLFDSGRLRAAVEVRSAVQEQALLSYQNAVLGALEDVENGLTAYAWARERISARSAAADAARTAAQLARNLYASGLTDFQRVLDTERTRLVTEDALAQAEATQVLSVIRLYKALGGGWQDASALATAGAAGPPPPSASANANTNSNISANTNANAAPANRQEPRQ